MVNALEFWFLGGEQKKKPFRNPFSNLYAAAKNMQNEALNFYMCIRSGPHKK